MVFKTGTQVAVVAWLQKVLLDDLTQRGRPKQPAIKTSAGSQNEQPQLVRRSSIYI